MWGMGAGRPTPRRICTKVGGERGKAQNIMSTLGGSNIWKGRCGLPHKLGIMSPED